MRRPITLLFVFVLLAALALGLAWFQFSFKPAMIAGFIAKAPQPVTSVAVEAAKTESWEARLPAIGTLVAIRGIDVAPQVGGIARFVQFTSGQDVEQGSPLVAINDDVEQADLKSGMANLKNAELALERQAQLNLGGNTAKSNLDLALATRDQAAAAVERTKATLAQKAIVAPFAGRLGISQVDPGKYVSPGTPLVTLQQLDPIFVDFPVPEKDYASLKVGQDVEMSADAAPGKLFKGKLVTIDARFDANTRNIALRAEVPNPDKKLLPGMFANVSVRTGAAKDVVTVPRTGVTFSLYGDAIFVVVPDPSTADQPADKQGLIVERRFVRTGEVRDDRVSLLEGAKAGERVVTQGQVKLQPKARVRVDDAAKLLTPTPLPRQ